MYLTGCSMGGEGVWRLAIASPQRFAAIAPVCGDAPSEALPDHVIRIKVPSASHNTPGPGRMVTVLSNSRFVQNMPTWVFHGVQDDVVPFDDSAKMVEALRQVGAPHVKFTQYKQVGHDAWTGAPVPSLRLSSLSLTKAFFSRHL